MSLVLAILAGWFLLSLAVALLFGRAARLEEGRSRLAGGSADPAYAVAVVPAPADASSRRHSGPAAA
jgi:hypothetical protein